MNGVISICVKIHLVKYVKVYDFLINNGTNIIYLVTTIEHTILSSSL